MSKPGDKYRERARNMGLGAMDLRIDLAEAADDVDRLTGERDECDERGYIVRQFSVRADAQIEADLLNIADAMRRSWHPSLCHCIAPEIACDPPELSSFRDAAKAVMDVVPWLDEAYRLADSLMQSRRKAAAVAAERDALRDALHATVTYQAVKSLIGSNVVGLNADGSVWVFGGLAANGSLTYTHGGKEALAPVWKKGEQYATADSPLAAIVRAAVGDQEAATPRKVLVHFTGGPWAGTAQEVERVTAPVFAVGDEIGNYYWLDTKSDPPTYFWGKS